MKNYLADIHFLFSAHVFDRNPSVEVSNNTRPYCVHPAQFKGENQRLQPYSASICDTGILPSVGNEQLDLS